MEILLFDEMELPELTQFRMLYSQQLEPGVGEANSFTIPKFPEVADAKRKWWREASMYPGLLTHSKNVNSQQRVADFKTQTSVELAAVLIRERFALGYFMTHPQATIPELTEMRSNIMAYLTPNPQFVQAYHDLWQIAEPNSVLTHVFLLTHFSFLSQVMAESLVFMAANPLKSDLARTLVPESVDLTLTPEGLAVVRLDLWPFYNFGCYHLDEEVEPWGEDVDLRAARYEDVQRYGGRWLQTSKCSCDSQENLFYCSFHQIVLCAACFNHAACHSSLGCVWRVDDEGAAMKATQDEDMDAMACMQLVGPNQDRRDVLLAAWGIEAKHVVPATRSK